MSLYLIKYRESFVLTKETEKYEKFKGKGWKSSTKDGNRKMEKKEERKDMKKGRKKIKSRSLK